MGQSGDWPKLEVVTLVLCADCLDGKGGECHTPGCALWMKRAPDVSIRSNVESPSFQKQVERGEMSSDGPIRKVARVVARLRRYGCWGDPWFGKLGLLTSDLAGALVGYTLGGLAIVGAAVVSGGYR